MRYKWHKFKQYLFPGFSFALNLLTALFWVALRVNYSGISKFLGADTNPSFLVMNLPVMVCVLAWIACAGALAGVLLFRERLEKRRREADTAAAALRERMCSFRHCGDVCPCHPCEDRLCRHA